MAIVEPIKPPRQYQGQYDPKEVDKFYQEMARRFSYHTYDGNPTNNILPRWVGDWALDITNTEWYRSTGLTVADWEVTT